MDRVDYQSLIIQDLLNDDKDEKLNLNPWYQRRSVWSTAQKSYLINTLLERKPIPALYIRHTIDLDRGRSIKEVVDGQQRSRAIIEYCKDAFSTRIPDSASRKKFSQLSNSEREKLLLTPIPVGYLLGASDEDVIDIFGRINSVSKSLNAQEKRNSKFSGEFKQFCLSFATRYLKFWRETGIFSANDIARMNEVQFVADIVLNIKEGVSDFRPRDLDRIYEENDTDFPDEQYIAQRLNAVMEKFLEIPPEAFKDTIFNRQPLFFSLFLAVDSDFTGSSEELESAMYTVDAEFHDDDIEDQDVLAFINAASSSTQRISSREVRHSFIVSRF